MLASNIIQNLNLGSNWKLASRLWKKNNNEEKKSSQWDQESLLSNCDSCEDNSLPALQGSLPLTELSSLDVRTAVLGNTPCRSHKQIPAPQLSGARGTVQRILTFKTLEEIKVFILAAVTRNVVATRTLLKLGDFNLVQTYKLNEVKAHACQ